MADNTLAYIVEPVVIQKVRTVTFIHIVAKNSLILSTRSNFLVNIMLIMCSAVSKHAPREDKIKIFSLET